MSFIDLLRQARSAKVTVLHEFLTQYDPLQRRIHAFFEGHDDVAFFVPLIERRLEPGTRLFPYRCEGKAQVYNAYAQVMERIPSASGVLFFVDKDLDDVVGAPWTTDPRIFVTDVYSIENYLVTSSSIRALYRDALRVVGVSFDVEPLVMHFDAQLSRFHKKCLVLMSWILVMRRNGAKLNLNNIDLERIFRVSDACEITAARGRALSQLDGATGSKTPSAWFPLMVSAYRELRRIPSKRVVRGKFEAWFLIQFWRRAIGQLRSVVSETGGKLQIKYELGEGNIVPTLVHYVDAPPALARFLDAHLRPSGLSVVAGKQPIGFFARMLEVVKTMLTR